MVVKNMMKSKPKQIKAEEGRIHIFTEQTTQPSKSMLDRLSLIYMVGFNNKPWDVYEWNISPERARKEFTKLVTTVLKAGGTFISFEHRGTPVGFNIITDMGVFVQRLEEVEGFKRLPKEFRSPKQYLETLSKSIRIPISNFGRIGYIADVVVDVSHRGRGYGRALIEASLKYLKDTGRYYVLAWSVNAVVYNILQQKGFEIIDEIGDKGEGIDFLVHNRVWYPTLDLPARERNTAGELVFARHYIKKLKNH